MLNNKLLFIHFNKTSVGVSPPDPTRLIRINKHKLSSPWIHDPRPCLNVVFTSNLLRAKKQQKVKRASQNTRN